MKKVTALILLSFALLSIAFFGGRYSLTKERALNVANLIAARDSISIYRVTIRGLENFVSVKNAIIEDQKDAIRLGLLDKERLKALYLKEVVANAKLTARISILKDSLKLIPGTTIITIKDTAGNYNDYVKIPFQLLKESDKYLTLNAGMDNSRLAWFDLQVPFSGEISIGYQWSGFLKTKPVGVFTSDNPYLKIYSMDALIIKENKKFYQKTWVHLLAGAVAVEVLHQFIK